MTVLIVGLLEKNVKLLTGDVELVGVTFVPQAVAMDKRATKVRSYYTFEGHTYFYKIRLCQLYVVIIEAF